MEARKSAKLLAWLIALAVVFTMTLPSSVVWAAEDNASDKAAKIGDQEYATLQKAVDEAKGDATIQMLKDVQEDVTIAEDDTITIDLNGKTITNVSGHTITNAGNLTVTGEGTVDNVTHAKGALVNTGTVILKGGTFTRSEEASKSPTDNGGNSWYVIDNQGKMTISDNAEIINNGYYSSLIRNMGSSAEKMASLEINGGKIEQKHFIAVKNDDFGKITVTGGTITSDDQAIQNWTEVSVTGGAIKGKVVTWAYTGGAASKTEIAGDVDITGNVMAVNYDGGKTIPTVSITGGKITGEVQKGEYKNNSIVLTDPDATSSDISITGGTFSTNPGKYIADGYLADKTEDGYQIIKEGDATENVALVGKTYYPTLKEAIDAAEAGDTVTLLKDITVDMGTDKNAAAIAITKNLTLDGNGKTIAANKIDAEKGMGHILGIQGANVKVRDLTIDGTDKSARHGIQVYGEGSKATLYSVTVKNCFGYGLVVNGATATATRLTTDGNGWGGVNVTKGVNITDNPSFTLNSGTLTDENPIQIDVEKGDLDADWVTFGEGAGEWDIITDAETGDGRPAIQWKPAKGEAVAQVNGSNYATLEAAITAAKENATVKLLKDIEFSVDGETDKNTSLIKINKALTLDGNGKTITVKGNVTEGKGHVIGIFDGAKVTVTDLTIDGGKAARHGIQTYINGSKATLQNVTVKNCLGYGVVANGSTIIADELYTSIASFK